jgi:hypothetical protein
VAEVRDIIVGNMLARYPFDDLLPVENAAHAFSLFFRGTLANATELRV